jgi:DNA-directed RNA polymerase specialized sigma24 family protein
VTASRKFSEFQGSPKPTGWLYNTLKNKIREIRHDRQNALKRIVSLDSAKELSVELETPRFMEMDENEDLKLLRHFYIEGFSLQEIAKEHGCTIAAIKMKIYRAKKRLKKDPRVDEI